jgi:hypothetical protein
LVALIHVEKVPVGASGAASGAVSSNPNLSSRVSVNNFGCNRVLSNAEFTDK